MRQTGPASLTDVLKERTASLKEAWDAFSAWRTGFQRLSGTRMAEGRFVDALVALCDGYPIPVLRLDRERKAIVAMSDLVRETATDAQSLYYRKLNETMREMLVAAYHEACFLGVVCFACMRGQVNEILDLETRFRALRESDERQRLRLLRVLDVSKTLELEPAIHAHWKREEGALDVGAIFEGGNEPALDPALVRRLKEHGELVSRTPLAGLSFSRLAAPMTWGVDALKRSMRQSLRSAYADEAPLEGLKRAHGVAVTRAQPVDPDTDRVLDVDEWLPAGEPFPEEVDPAEILVQKEEREAAHGKVQRAEASFHAELDSLHLTTAQTEVLLDHFLRAPQSGFGPASKKGRSMRQYWGTDYGAKQRMQQRLEKAHPAFFDKWSRLLLGIGKSEPS
jgi:hypothetical protein